MRRARVQEDSDPESNSNVCEEQQRRDGRKQEAHHRPKSSSQHRAARRPDKLLYMPRAARERLSLQQEPSAEAASAPSRGSDSGNSGSSPAVGQERLPAATPSSPGHAAEEPLPPDECLPPLADLTVQEDEKEQESLPETLDGDLMNEVKIHEVCTRTLLCFKTTLRNFWNLSVFFNMTYIYL